MTPEIPKQLWVGIPDIETLPEPHYAYTTKSSRKEAMYLLSDQIRSLAQILRSQASNAHSKMEGADGEDFAFQSGRCGALEDSACLLESLLKIEK